MISKKKIATYICSEFLKNTYKGKDETLELAIEREHSYRYFPWIWASREPNKMAWVSATNIQLTTLLQGCYFLVIYKLYVILWVWPYIRVDVFPVDKLKQVHLERHYNPRQSGIIFTWSYCVKYYFKDFFWCGLYIISIFK